MFDGLRHREGWHRRRGSDGLQSLRKIPPGEAVGDQLGDLLLALVGRGVDEVAYVRLRQITRQHQHRGQVHLTFSQRREDEREPARRPGGVDAPRGRAFAVVQLLEAVGVHRRVAILQVDLQCIELGDAGEQHGRGDAVFAIPRLELLTKCLATEVGRLEEVHDRVLQRGLVARGRCGAFALSHAHFRRTQGHGDRETRRASISFSAGRQIGGLRGLVCIWRATTEGSASRTKLLA
jgi:hypothetical protein